LYRAWKAMIMDVSCPIHQTYHFPYSKFVGSFKVSKPTTLDKLPNLTFFQLTHCFKGFKFPQFSQSSKVNVIVCPLCFCVFVFWTYFFALGLDTHCCGLVFMFLTWLSWLLPLGSILMVSKCFFLFMYGWFQVLFL
jgi:hypothetical protein